MSACLLDERQDIVHLDQGPLQRSHTGDIAGIACRCSSPMVDVRRAPYLFYARSITNDADAGVVEEMVDGGVVANPDDAPPRELVPAYARAHACRWRIESWLRLVWLGRSATAGDY